MVQSRAKKVAKSITSILAFYSVGQRLRRQGRLTQGSWHRFFAERETAEDVNRDTLRNAVNFADPQKGYTPKELKTLCEQVKRIQSKQDPDKAIFSRAHLLRLLTIQSKKERLMVQTKAVQDGWSVRRLNEALNARFGSRRHGGRRPTIPATIDQLLGQIEHLCETWRRWKQDLSRDGSSVGKQTVTLEALDDDLQEAITAATDAVEELQRLVNEKMSQTKRGRSLRPFLQSGETAKQTARTKALGR